MKKVLYGTFFVLVENIKICLPVREGEQVIIIKIKFISIEKSVLNQRLMPLFLLICVSFMFVSRVQAATLPLQSLIDFSKEKLTETKKVVIENPVVTEQAKVEQSQKSDKNLVQLINEKTEVPATVSDPAEIEKAVEFAADATGVRKNFIMGLLVVESDLGRNPGKCTYQEVEDGANIDHKNGRLSTQAWNTFQERREIIKNVAQSLGYDYEKLNVSCNPGAAYAGTGGAMGIPQFMPDTWMEYKDRISAIVGKRNPDPWNEKDAAVAVALKLSDVYGVTSHDRLAERNAAKMYLSGTTSWRYDWYANKILYWAENYNSLIG